MKGYTRKEPDKGKDQYELYKRHFFLKVCKCVDVCVLMHMCLCVHLYSRRNRSDIHIRTEEHTSIQKLLAEENL